MFQWQIPSDVVAVQSVSGGKGLDIIIPCNALGKEGEGRFSGKKVKAQTIVQRVCVTVFHAIRFADVLLVRRIGIVAAQSWITQIPETAQVIPLEKAGASGCGYRTFHIGLAVVEVYVSTQVDGLLCLGIL